LISFHEALELAALEFRSALLAAVVLAQRHPLPEEVDMRYNLALARPQQFERSSCYVFDDA
jgi:hypothetical protein